MLTEEQIKNWKRVLPTFFGIDSTFLTDEHIEQLKEKLQKQLDDAVTTEVDIPERNQKS